MPGNSTPAFLVDAYSDPILIKVQGRASFSNSAAIREFLTESIKEGKRRFVFDFSDCTGMDSTFLGVLAGAALELRKSKEERSLVFCRMNPRNLELIYNLGLHRLATVDAAQPVDGASASKPLDSPRLDELESARMCLEAHEKLVEADPENQRKFQDVLTLLKNRVDKK